MADVPLLVPNLDVVDGVGGLHIDGDGLSDEDLDEDLHTTTQTEDESECRLLDVLVGETATIFKLLSSEDEALLKGCNSIIRTSQMSLSERIYA